MYWSQGDRLDELAAEGFDRCYAWAAPDGSSLGFCDKAQGLGLKVTLELNYLIGDGAQTLADIDRWIEPYIDRPEVTMWKLSDEPDLRGMDPDAFYEGYAHLKARDPSRPIELVIRYPQRESGMPYIPACDIVGLDSYPIPYRPRERCRARRSRTRSRSVPPSRSGP